MFSVEVITNLVKMIGIKGFIIIGLVLLSSIEYKIIEKKRDQVQTLKSTISINELRIKEQNASIDAANKEAKSVQDKLDASEKERVKINNAYQTLKNNMNNQPIAKDCPSAIVELKMQTTTLIKKWNAGGTK